MIRVVHTADNHLDPKFSFLGAKRFERRQDFFNSFRRVVEFAIERKANIFLVSGDLFDSVNPRNPVRTQVIRLFRRLSSEGVKVFMVAGNHDMPRSQEEGMSPLQEVEAAGYARFFSKTGEVEVEHLSISGLDVAVAGLSYDHTVGFDENPLRRNNVRLPREGDIAIAVMHYNFSGINVPPGWRAPRVSWEDFPENYLYVALGHVHSYMALPIRGKTLAAYPGSTERRSFQEEGDEAKGFLYVELNHDSPPRAEFITVPTRPMRTVKVSLSEDTQDPIREIVSRLPAPNPNLLLRLIVEGALPISKIARYNRAALLRELEERFFAASIDDMDLKCVLHRTVETGKEMKSPIDAFVEAVQELVRSAEGEEKEIYKLALDVGRRVLEESGAW
jgi:DNA repair exonuclease SbcCD nuclease subunit